MKTMLPVPLILPGNDHSPSWSNEASSPLLEAYTPHKTAYFSSPKHRIVAATPTPSLRIGAPSDLSGEVAEQLTDAAKNARTRPIIIGAIPFDTTQDSRLYLSTNVLYQRRLPNERVLPFPPIDVQASHVEELPSGEHYESAVAEVVEQIQSGKLDKAVLSRSLKIKVPKLLEIDKLIARLESTNQEGFTFAIGVEPPPKQRATGRHASTLLGASPELLVSIQGRKVFTNPLAGSLPRGTTSEFDQRQVKRLRTSGKDLHEHRLVVDAVVASLQPFCKNLLVPTVPTVQATDAMWHLSTPIEGELKDPRTSSLQVALALHPTPAVCGTPTANATKLIEQLEGYQRGMFAGIVGWEDSTGDGEWAVTIRCAEVTNQDVRLYAGAGIVSGSLPADEFAETTAKLKTMLRALGVSAELVADSR